MKERTLVWYNRDINFKWGEDMTNETIPSELEFYHYSTTEPGSTTWGSEYIRESFDRTTPMADRLLQKKLNNLNLWLTQNNAPQYIREAVLKEILDCKYRLSLGIRRVPYPVEHNPTTPSGCCNQVEKQAPEKTTEQLIPGLDGNLLTSQFILSLGEWQVEITCKKS